MGWVFVFFDRTHLRMPVPGVHTFFSMTCSLVFLYSLHVSFTALRLL
jgi:hypothetical protein